MSNNPTQEPKKPPMKRKAPRLSDEQFEKFYSQILTEFGPQSQNEDLLKDVPQRNSTKQNSAGEPKSGKSAAQNTYADASGHKSKKENNRPLIIAICLESLGIVGVILWWVLRIL